MVTWSCTQVRIYLRKYTYTAVFAEALWMRMRESCVRKYGCEAKHSPKGDLESFGVEIPLKR